MVRTCDQKSAKPACYAAEPYTQQLADAPLKYEHLFWGLTDEEAALSIFNFSSQP